VKEHWQLCACRNRATGMLLLPLTSCHDQLLLLLQLLLLVF
jgi:hypothetical protein